MTDDPASLSKLHDIVMPAEVSWWPLAPGWIVLLTALLLALIYYAFRSFRSWRRNAYRREAIRALESARTNAQVSELLRRTALTIEARESIASLQGERWIEWLEGKSSIKLTDSVRSALSKGVYDPASATNDLAELRQFAESWIRQHRTPC